MWHGDQTTRKSKHVVIINSSFKDYPCVEYSSKRRDWCLHLVILLKNTRISACCSSLSSYRRAGIQNEQTTTSCYSSVLNASIHLNLFRVSSTKFYFWQKAMKLNSLLFYVNTIADAKGSSWSTSSWERSAINSLTDTGKELHPLKRALLFPMA